MKIVEMNAGRKIEYEISGNKICFDDDLTINLAKREEDETVDIDVCYDKDKNLVIGFDADVKIALTTLPDVLKIPVEAVVYDNGSYYVFVYDKAKGVVEKRDIAHGVLDDTSYQIIDGLKEGEIVIKSPDPNTVDGTKVAEKKA